MHTVRIRFLFLLIGLFALLVGVGACSPAPSGDGGADGGSGSGDGGGDSSDASAVPFVAESTVGQDVVLTTVTDSDGAVEVEIEVDLTEARIRLPMEDGESVLEFPEPLVELPSEEAANAFGTFVAGQLTEARRLDSLRIRDNPGCDWVPFDPRCMVRCCAAHDACYYESGCSALSWLPTLTPVGVIAPSACVDCNVDAALCVLGRCPISEGDPNDIACFDARCGEGYACPSLDCDACLSPCTCLEVGLELSEEFGDCRDPEACFEVDGTPCLDGDDVDVPDSVGTPGGGSVRFLNRYMTLTLQSGPSIPEVIDVLDNASHRDGEIIDETLAFNFERGCTRSMPDMVARHEVLARSFDTSPVNGRMVFDYITRNPDAQTQCDVELDNVRAQAQFEASVDPGQTLTLSLRVTREEGLSPNRDFVSMYIDGAEVVAFKGVCTFDCQPIPGTFEMAWTFDELMEKYLTDPAFSPRYTRGEGFDIFVLVDVYSYGGADFLSPVAASRNTIEWSIEVE